MNSAKEPDCFSVYGEFSPTSLKIIKEIDHPRHLKILSISNYRDLISKRTEANPHIKNISDYERYHFLQKDIANYIFGAPTGYSKPKIRLLCWGYPKFLPLKMLRTLVFKG